MAALVCDICGGKLMMGTGGVATCDSCGMEHSKDRMQEKIQEIKGTVSVSNIASAESLMKRGHLALEDKNWKQADDCFDKVLDITPEYAPAYIGKLCAELEVCNEELIVEDSHKSLSGLGHFQKAVRFSNAETQTRLKSYDEKVRNRLEECERLEQGRKRREQERERREQKRRERQERWEEKSKPGIGRFLKVIIWVAFGFVMWFTPIIRDQWIAKDATWIRLCIPLALVSFVVAFIDECFCCAARKNDNEPHLVGELGVAAIVQAITVYVWMSKYTAKLDIVEPFPIACIVPIGLSTILSVTLGGLIGYWFSLPFAKKKKQ